MAVWLGVCSICLTPASLVHADQFGLFTYVEYDTYIEITDYPETAIGEVVVPSEIVGKPVARIGDRAFYRCSGLTNVTIPDSVTSIGSSAFSSCSSLTYVTIPGSVTSIGSHAFHGCSSLTSVTIPDGVTSIGNFTFYWCSSLTSVAIPNSVTSIGNSAFSSCSGLTSVTIPDSVTSIGDKAFDFCSSLLAFQVSESNLFYSSMEGVLFDKPQTTLLSYPGGRVGVYVIPDSVTSIGNSAFNSCSSLTEVTIPDSVISIGESAFKGCTSLISVTLGDGLNRIGRAAFNACRSLNTVTIPDSVTEIGDLAFAACDSLTVLFSGDAPSIVPTYFLPHGGGQGSFMSTRATFFYYEGAVGFDGPKWQDFQLTAIPRSAPLITNQPRSVAVEAGAKVVFSAEAVTNGVGTYRWQKDGIDLNDGDNVAGATTDTLTLESAIVSDAGYYSLVVSDTDGSTRSEMAVLSLWSSDGGRLSNLSTRGVASVSNAKLIAGFVISGGGPRTMLIRGIGPSLGLFIGTDLALDDSAVVVYSGDSEILNNEDWATQPDWSAVELLASQVGAFPLDPDSKDAALTDVFEPGAYSVHLSGKGGPGLGLVEIYDGNDSGDSRLMNLSTRGWVGTGAAIMVPGIVVTHNPRRLLIRGIAPELAVSFGLNADSVLPNPRLTLKDKDGVTIASNDDWGSSDDPAMIVAVTQQVGAFPLSEGSADAALLIEVQPGVYTAHVSDADGGEGIALVEVYAAP